jgi:hypothetical protein
MEASLFVSYSMLPLMSSFVKENKYIVHEFGCIGIIKFICNPGDDS